MAAFRASAGERTRWIVLAILFAARFSLGFQFQTAGSVTPFLLRDFDSDYAGVGALVGLFMLPGLVFAVPAGFLGQRFGDKRLALAGLLMLALGGIVSAFGEDYQTIAAGRIISGTGGVILLILLTKMLADWFADKEIFLGMALYIIGWPVGIAAGQAVQPQIAETAGWSAVFITSALLCIVAFALIAIFYRSPDAVATIRRRAFGTVSRSEFILVNIAGLGWMFVNGAYLVLVSFGPVLLDERGVAFADAARVTSVMSWVFLFALPLGGYLATRFEIPKTVLTVGFGGSVVVGAMIPYVDAPFVTFALFGILYAAAAPVLGALPAQILKPENRAPGMGIYFMWFFLGCTTLPALGGYLNDVAGTAAAPIFFAVAMMLATLTSAFAVYAMQRRWSEAPVVTE